MYSYPQCAHIIFIIYTSLSLLLLFLLFCRHIDTLFTLNLWAKLSVCGAHEYAFSRSARCSALFSVCTFLSFFLSVFCFLFFCFLFSFFFFLFLGGVGWGGVGGSSAEPSPCNKTSSRIHIIEPFCII